MRFLILFAIVSDLRYLSYCAPLNIKPENVTRFTESSLLPKNFGGSFYDAINDTQVVLHDETSTAGTPIKGLPFLSINIPVNSSQEKRAARERRSRGKSQTDPKNNGRENPSERRTEGPRARLESSIPRPNQPLRNSIRTSTASSIKPENPLPQPTAKLNVNSNIDLLTVPTTSVAASLSKSVLSKSSDQSTSQIQSGMGSTRVGSTGKSSGIETPPKATERPITFERSSTPVIKSSLGTTSKATTTQLVKTEDTTLLMQVLNTHSTQSPISNPTLSINTKSIVSTSKRVNIATSFESQTRTTTPATLLHPDPLMPELSGSEEIFYSEREPFHFEPTPISIISGEDCDLLVDEKLGIPPTIVELANSSPSCRTESSNVNPHQSKKRGNQDLSFEEENIEEGQQSKRTKFLGGPRCLVTLSEVYLGSGDNLADEFVELSMKCDSKSGPPPKNILNGYSLLIFRCQPFALVLVADLGDKSFDINGFKNFLVLGSDHTPHVDIRLDQPGIKSIYQEHNRGHLPTMKDSPYAFVITYSKLKRPLKNFQLLEVSQKFYPQSMNLMEKDLDALKSVTVDMLIVGSKDQSKSCGSLNSFWPVTLPFERPVLQRANNIPHITSISKCFSLYEGFQPQHFFTSKPTAGESNDCSQKISLLEESEGIVVQRKGPEEEPQLSCNSNSNAPESNSPKLDYQIVVDVGRKSIYSNDQVNQEVLNQCSGQLPASEQVLQIPGISDWLKVIVSQGKCSFVCKYCSGFFLFGFRPDIKHKQNIMKPTGFSSKSPYGNYRQLKHHDQHNLHKSSKAFAENFIKANTQEEANIITHQYEDEEAKIFEPTRNLVRFVYAELKAGLSFKAHETLIEAVSLAGANVGSHHQSSTASLNIMNSISSEFHKKLLNYLTEQKPPFSIIVDSTTNQNEPLLIVYIQTIEDTYPVMYFYGLISLDNGEKATEMTKSFEARIEEDNKIQEGFKTFFQTSLVSIVSDGASVMVGIKHSFHVLLETFVNKKVPLIKCFAHKLDLGVKAGLKPRKDKLVGLDEHKPADKLKIDQLRYFQEFERHNNEFYRFYAGRAHKKWMHLCHMAQEKGEIACTAKYFQPIRWSESSYNCMDSVAKNFNLYAEDLVLISTEKDFDKTSQQEASRLYTKITDKTFAIVVREFLDFLNIFKILSKKLQESSGILIGKSKLILESLQELFDLKNTPGPKVTEFLRFCHCDKICQLGNCNYEDYDKCPMVWYKSMVLRQNDPLGIKMGTVRGELYDNLIKNVSGYFDIPEIQAFDVLDPSQLNFAYDKDLPDQPFDKMFIPVATYEAVPVLNTDARSKVIAVCRFYKYPVQTCEIFLFEFRNILGEILQHEFLKEFFSEDAAKFWPLALAQADLSWTELTREVVMKVLVTPFASSDCERGFSFVNALRSKERSSLTTKALEGRVRVKANGPDDLKDFDDYYYTRKFLEDYARVDDAEVSGGRPSNPLNEAFFFRKSRLFRRNNV